MDKESDRARGRDSEGDGTDIISLAMYWSL